MHLVLSDSVRNRDFARFAAQGKEQGPPLVGAALSAGLRADINGRADLRDGVKFLGELRRQTHAAVARGLARIVPGMERNPVIIDALHPGHGCVVVLARAVHRLLVED